MELTIRSVRADDAATVLAHSKIIGGETRNVTFGPEGIPLTEEKERAYLASLEQSPDTCMLLAFDGGELVATAHVGRVSPKARLSHRAGVAVSVKKSHWNRGVATRLLEECIQRGKAMGCTVLELDVLETNAAAIHVYEKLGFRRIGRFERFLRYEDGTFGDALLMNLYL